MGGFSNRVLSLINGLREIPTGTDWLILISSLILYGLLAYPVAIRSGFARRASSSRSLQERVILGLRTLLHPSLFEEAFYRGLLLPPLDTPLPENSDLAWLVLSLFLFILAHPINGLLRREARATFTHPGFLLLAGLMGCINSLLYWSTGSLWPSVLLHWIVVYLWFDRFGGEQALSGST
jgi:predicted Abi (CAAX) family protease